MADQADIALDVIENNLNHALSISKKFDGPSSTECQNCGNEIPPQRQALGNIHLCIDCQTAVEATLKHYL